MSLLSALTTAILPVLSVAGVGFVLGRVRDVEVDALVAVSIYVLTPALVFHSVATSSLSGGAVARVAVGVVGFTLAMVAVAELVSLAAGHDEPIRGALALTSAFPNAGNYGIPLSAFAFGAVGRSTAVLFIVAQSIVMYTFGVYLASRSGTGPRRDAVRDVFRLPLVYAVVGALLARAAGVVPAADSTVMETLALTGNAAIPVMLLLLGVQLANTTYGATLRKVGPATALKLGVAPIVAAGVAVALGFRNATVARVFVLECAMPAAVTPVMLTMEYGGDADGVTGPEYVTTAVLVTTLLSVPTLAVVLAVLGSGAVL